METKFFFIDEQGDIKNNQDWLLLGGILIEVKEYHNLSKSLRQYNKSFLNNKEIREIKWSDIQQALYHKSKYMKIKNNKSYYYLDNKTIEDIEEYITNFFDILSSFNFKIILSISNKGYFNFSLNTNFIKLQLEDLMERVQYELQPENLGIFVHDSRSDKKTNKEIKQIYKNLLSSSRFVNNYKNIIDNLFIEDSHLNMGIQTSDFIIGVVSGTLRGYSFSKELYKKYIKEKIRRNENGNCVGYGILPTGLSRDENFKNYLIERLEIA